MAGLILGYLAIVLTVLAVITFGAVGAAAIPVMEKAQIEAGKYVCINNLRQIEMAKEMWAIDNAMGPGDTPSTKDIEAYIGMSVGDLECPAGGTCSINPLGQLPTCSHPEHRLE